MKIKLEWFGINIYSKPFKAIGGFTSRTISWVFISAYNKHHKKRWGKYLLEFDGYEFYFFNLYFISINWGTLPDKNFAHKKMKEENWVNPYK